MDLAGGFAMLGPWDSFYGPLFAICVGGPLLLGLLCRAMRMIETTSKNYYQIQLKMKMVEKGYSASEIERVAQLKPGESGSDWEPVIPAKPMKV